MRHSRRLRSTCSICSMIFGTVKFVSSISCTVYTCGIASEPNPNSEVARILPLSLGFLIGGDFGVVPQTQQSCSEAWLLWFHGSAIAWFRPIGWQGLATLRQTVCNRGFWRLHCTLQPYKIQLRRLKIYFSPHSYFKPGVTWPDT